MTAKIIGGILRALLASLGGAGLVSDGDLEQAIGAATVLLSIAWSVYQKRQARADVAR